MKPALLALALLTGCGDIQGCVNGSIVGRYRDEDARVTCWTIRVADGVGISCLPDSALARDGAR